LLTLAALPQSASCRARVVLMSPSKPDAATGTNAGLLAEYFDARRIFEVPWLGQRPDAGKVLKDSRGAAHAPDVGGSVTQFFGISFGGVLVARNDSRHGW
jgi:hypothetical protein